jgi:hypothetical protein
VKKSEWSDKQLIELLRQMPKVQDHRNPRDIYQNLSLKKRKKWSIRIGPGFAAAAALAIVIILVPKLISSPQIAYDKTGNEKMSTEKSDASGNNQNMSKMRKQVKTFDKVEFSTESQQDPGSKTAVYAEEVGNRRVLTYWIPDQQAQLLIPVSTVVNEDNQKSWVTLFNEKMLLLKEKEQEWGLSDFYPLNATLNVDNTDNSATVDVPLNHSYGQGSNEMMFLDVLKKDISSNSDIKRIKLYTNGKSGIDFSDYGKKVTVDIDEDIKHAYFFYNPNKSETPFLVPSLDKYNDLKTALSAMEKDDKQNSGLKASLPSHYFKEMSIKDNIMYLSLNSNSSFKNNSENLHSFEALLLTAKEFGMQKVYINNSPIKKLGSFDLSKEVDVPIAPNFRALQ